MTPDRTVFLHTYFPRKSVGPKDCDFCPLSLSFLMKHIPGPCLVFLTDSFELL